MFAFLSQLLNFFYNYKLKVVLLSWMAIPRVTAYMYIICVICVASSTAATFIFPWDIFNHSETRGREKEEARGIDIVYEAL